MARLLDEHENFGSKAPIVEALIDLRCSLGAGVQFEHLVKIRERHPEFTRVELQAHVEHRIEFRDGGEKTQTTKGVRGYLFRNEVESQAVQARRDGFTFSQLNPYRSWDDLKAKAAIYWSDYREFAQPRAVTRVAVRYINRIRVPQDPIVLEDWTTTRPLLSERLKTLQPTAVLARFIVPHPSGKFTTIVMLLTEPPADNQTPMIVDIDAFAPLDDRSLTDKQMWDILDELRDFKNDIFFGSLTNRAKDLFR